MYSLRDRWAGGNILVLWYLASKVVGSAGAVGKLNDINVSRMPVVSNKIALLVVDIVLIS